MVDRPTHSDTHKTPICVRNVFFRWENGRSALNNVSLTVKEGELTMILGHNGSGKSTLLRILRGVLNPSAGDVYLEKPCAYVQQDPNLQIVLPTIGTDIASSIPKDLSSQASDVRQAVINALNAVGLTPPEDFMPKSSYRLSGGQRQRAAVAAALAMEPRTILFDEVTANMDPFNKAELVSRIRQIVTERNMAAIWPPREILLKQYAPLVCRLKKNARSTIDSHRVADPVHS
ncbi:energy-coupling factor transporter ATPase [Gracilaria domingensis]|nr:energy-coupling factor transporter ATPase [Gracilaria domingensis]